MAPTAGTAAGREASLLPIALFLIVIVVLAVAGFAVAPHLLHLTQSVTHLKPSSPAGP